jgi:hypothetical protein
MQHWLDKMKQKMFLIVLGVLVVLFLSSALFFKWMFAFDPMNGDVKTYWDLSLNRSYLFNAWWVPGYPFIISLARAISLNKLPPAALMQLVSGIGYIIGGVGVYLLLKQENQTLAVICACIYALFPFTGVVYAVFPIADSLALAALVFCIYFLYKRNWLLLAISIAVALLLQKVTWFFIPLIVLLAICRDRKSILFMIMAAMPLLLYFGIGAIVKHDLFWAFRWSVDNLMTAQSSLPVLDGLIGPFLTGLSPTKLAKSIVVLIIFLVAIVTLLIEFRQKQYEAVVVSAGLLLMVLTVNQYEIWSFVRYSKLIIIPIGLILLKMPRLSYKISKPVVLLSIFTLCILSNTAYAYYLSKIYY